MNKMSHTALGAPSAWRGLQTPAPSRKTLGGSVVREFQEHPLETLGYIAAAVVIARLALTGAKKPSRSSEASLAARRRTGH
jgi:hypothetical protein